VFCQLDTLRRCIPASIRKALRELPITLDETYEKTLECIPKEKRRHAYRLFQCLIAAVRPLRVEELTEIFAIEFDSKEGPNLVEGWRPEDPEEAVLAACSSLISIVNVKNSKIVQFSHFSVEEFLTSERLVTSNIGNISGYHIPLESAHSFLARACLTVLLQFDDRIDEKRLGTFPLAPYAGCHWIGHAKFGNIASELGDAMECLFDPKKPHLAVWIWIYDVDDAYGRSTVDLAERPPPPVATPLYYAAFCGFSALVKRLITAHAEDPNAKCGRRGTPLHGACLGGQLECMRVLLESGADIGAQDNEGFAVLHIASEDGKVEVAGLLLQHNADVNAKTKYGTDRTPLIYASANGHVRVAQLLLEHGADLNLGDEDGDTALGWASVNGNLDVVRLLLGHGADVNIGGTWTPFKAATEYGHVEIAQLLLEHGAQRE
jgi:ankyrin repeat protein